MEDEFAELKTYLDSIKVRGVGGKVLPPHPFLDFVNVDEIDPDKVITTDLLDD